MKYYTGIGSRDITQVEFNLLSEIGQRLAGDGYCLRSGGAKGADTAFEHGCCDRLGNAEIYIPWNGFGEKLINPNSKRYIPSQPKFEEARDYLIQQEIIPWFDRMKQGAQKLHARNYYQVRGLGDQLSEILVYCSEDDNNGIPRGGTRTAVLLAKSFDIPTYNIRDTVQRDKLLNLLGMNVHGIAMQIIEEN